MTLAATVGTDTLQIAGAEIELRYFSARHSKDAAYRDWLRDPEIVRTLNLPRYLEQPITDAEIDTYVEQITKSPNDLFFAIHHGAEDTFIGTIKAGKIDRYAGHADIGIMIGRKAFWGRGLATDAIATLCQYLFDDAGLRRLTAGSMATNPSMIHVFEKLGFRQEGVFREQDRVSENGYCDHIHLGCLRDEFSPPAAGAKR
jgi:ribosomal-protein-alanine N-acetyltransferase